MRPISPPLSRALLSHPRKNPNPAFRRRRCLLAAMSSTETPDIVVTDTEALARKVAAILAAGSAKLQVIADFDGTLTRYWYGGKRGLSSHPMLTQGNEEYDAKRKALFEHYRPIEISPDIPLQEKAELMKEWWEKTHNLLIEGGVTYEAVNKSVADAGIDFRDGVMELF